MKKVFIAIGILLMMCSIAWAATYIGTTYLWGSDKIRQTLWTYEGSNIINSSTMTDAYEVQPLCTKASIIFGDLSGTGIKNVEVLTSYTWSADENLRPSDSPIFYNSIGSTSKSYHELSGVTDTQKIDMSQRWFNTWRLKCVSGCDLTNTIGTAVGFCGKDVE